MIPTLIGVILDESGSMEPKASDVRGGFNRFLEDQKAEPGECRLTLTKFNTIYGTSPVMPLVMMTPLDRGNYITNGATALYDAVASTIKEISLAKKGEERVLCVIITDGEENSSKETTLEQILQLIASKETEGDWTFVYLGVSPDSWVSQALAGGVAANAVAYNSMNPMESYANLSKSTTQYRASASNKSEDFWGGKDPHGKS